LNDQIRKPILYYRTRNMQLNKQIWLFSGNCDWNPRV